MNTVFQEGGYTNRARVHIYVHTAVCRCREHGDTDGHVEGAFLNPGGVSTLFAGGAKSQGNAHPVWLREWRREQTF